MKDTNKKTKINPIVDMNFPMFLVTTIQCTSCGGERRFAIFPKPPTAEQINNVGYGSNCEITTTTKITELKEVYSSNIE